MQTGLLTTSGVRGRKCVCLYVSRQDIRLGINARRPGWHLFRGYWYGGDPLSIDSYGKIEGRVRGTLRVIGRVRSHHQAFRLKL